MKKIGILGGTFNPVHLEHVSLAIKAVEGLGLDQLIVMPTYISPHKNDSPVDCAHRLNMLKIAFRDCEKVMVSDYEILKQGKSYTYLTVEHFKKENDCELFFIVGADMLKDFKNWRYPERILSACNLVAFGRESFETDFSAEREHFIKTFNKDFILLPYCGKDASSTKIRTYLEFGISTEGILDDKVLEYIKENGLYQGDKYVRFVKNNLPLKRLKHTADVVVCALKRAKELGLETDVVKTTATLHDCAKYMDYRTVNGFVIPPDVPAPVVHSFLGAYIAKNVLNIDDEMIIDAIRYHTSGKAEMSTLAKLIFVADMVEEGRVYEGVDKLRLLYETADFESCFVECLKEEVLHLINKKQYIYIETLNAFDYYVKK